MTTSVQRGRRWAKRNRQLISALESIRKEKTDFLSSEVGIITGDKSVRVGRILMFTDGVRSLKKGRWQFTGEPLRVQGCEA